MSDPIVYSSTDAGAPVLNSLAGSLLEVVRACAVNGYGLRAVSSIVVASGVATANCATHGFVAQPGRIVRVAGASIAGLNGDVQLTAADINTFSYPVPGVPDGTYTGSMTAMRPPLGWIEAFTGTNRAIFARSTPQATGSMLRIVDTRAAPALPQYAQVTMVASATDVDTVTDVVPSDLSIAYWSTGEISLAAKPWTIVGDDRWMWLLLPSPSGSGAPVLYCFGDPVMLNPGDAGGAILCVHGQTAFASAIGGLTLQQILPSASTSQSSSTEVSFFHRSLAGVSGRYPVIVCGAPGWGSAGVSGDAVVPVLPGFFARSASAFRGQLPGLWIPQGNKPFASGVVHSFPGLDRDLLALEVRTEAGGASGQVMLDVTGPWR